MTEVMRTDAVQAGAGSELRHRSVSDETRMKLRQKATEFEATYIAQMLKPMFDGTQADAPFGAGNAEDIWRSLELEEYGKAIAHSGGIGIGDAVYRELLAVQERKGIDAMTTDATLAAADRLAQIIAAENAALKDRDWAMVRQLAGEKRLAAGLYEAAFQDLGDPASLPVTERERLHGAGERLAAAAEENERRLTLVMFAQRRVMAAISEAVVAAGSSAATYGRTGGISRGRSCYAPPALSLNRAL